MTSFPKYTLRTAGWRRGWRLVRDSDQRVVAEFPSKEHATRAGGLERAIGEAGGSVRVLRKDGELDEVRDLPTPPIPEQPLALREPAFLPHLLPYNRCRGTRFADCRHRNAPIDPTRLAQLLEACGYEVRVGGVLEVLGAHLSWLPVPHVLSNAPMPVLALLRYVCERDWPARPMNPNDERFKAVFAAS